MVYQAIFDSMKMNDLETARHNQIKSIRTVEVIIKYGGGCARWQSDYEADRVLIAVLAGLPIKTFFC